MKISNLERIGSEGYKNLGNETEIPVQTTTPLIDNEPDNRSETEKYLALREKRNNMTVEERVNARVQAIQKTSLQKPAVGTSSFGMVGNVDLMERKGAAISGKLDTLIKPFNDAQSELITAQNSLTQAESVVNSASEKLQQAQQRWATEATEESADLFRTALTEYTTAYNTYTSEHAAYSKAWDAYKTQEEEIVRVLADYQMCLSEYNSWQEAITQGAGFESYAKAGLEKFEADRAAANKQKYGSNAWEQFLIANAKNYLASTDNPITTQMNLQAQQYRDDTSYREPSEKWTQEQRYVFGYLYNQSPAQAYSYAKLLNDQIASSERNANIQKVMEEASKNLGSGAIHTLGALITAPTGIADLMDNIAEFMGRGTITQKGGTVLSPFDYSQAVVGGISGTLNALGTLDESVPIIGGKGFGDVYQLGFSMAQSMIAGKFAQLSGSSLATLLQFFGQAGAASVDDALSRGGTGEQALLYGLSCGVAEALAENVGIEKMLKIQSADTLKGWMKNMFKQGLAEGGEELLTSVVDTIADGIIMADKSVYSASVQRYMQTMSKEDAELQAFRDMLNGIAYDGLSGFASGTGHGLIATGIKSYEMSAATKKLMKLYELNTVTKNDAQEIINSGLESARGTESYKLATQLKAKLDAGTIPSAGELGRLLVATEIEIQRENASSGEGVAGPEGLSLPTLEDADPSSNIPWAVMSDPAASLQLPTVADVTQNAPSVTERGGNVTPATQSVTADPQNVTENQMINTAVPAGEAVPVAAQSGESQNGGTPYVNNQVRRAGPAAAQPAGGSTGAGGNGLLSGSGQRNAGTGTGEQAGSLDSRAGSVAAKQSTDARVNRIREAAARSNLARNLRLEKVSAVDVGLKSGTNTKSLQILPQEHWDAELQTLAQKIREETGKEPVFVVGDLRAVGKDGKSFLARAAITDTRVIVLADYLHREITLDQIVDHEIFHDRARTAREDGYDLNAMIEEKILERYTMDEFSSVLDAYIVALRGRFGLDGAESGAQYEAAMAKIKEELFADAYAGINAFDENAGKFTGAVDESLNRLHLGRNTAQENGVRQTNGPPATKENTADVGGEAYSLSEFSAPTREALEAKPDVAVVDISKPKTTGTFSQRREKILRDVAQVISQPYLNKDTDVMIFLTEKSYTHAFSNKGEMNINAVERLPELVRNAVLTHVEKNTHGSDYAVGSYTFFAAAKNNSVLPVKLKVKEYKYVGQDIPKNIKAYFDNNPQGYAAAYDTVVLGVEEIEESPTGSAKDMDQMDPFQGPEELSVISVADLLDLVKGDARRYIPDYSTKTYSVGESSTENADIPEESFSFAGEKAQGADMEALGLAKDMLAAGVAEDTIRQQTGWHRGMDGKWRWEIDDSSMRYDSSGDLRGAESARWAQEDLHNAREELWGHADMETLDKVRAYNRAVLAGDQEVSRELYDDLIDGPHAYYFGQYAESYDRARGTVQAPTGGTLQDYIDHPALFRAYPQLKDVSLRFERMTGGNKGYFDHSDNTIVLNSELRSAPESTLIHEIQHAIQSQEGFARGASPEFWEQRQAGSDPVTRYGNDIRDAEQKLETLLGKLPPNVAAQFEQYAELDQTDPEAAQKVAEELSDGPYAEQFGEYFLLRWGADQMKEGDYKRGPMDLYRNTAGEIEARDAASRRELDSDRRLQTAPQRGDGQTVFADDTGISFDKDISNYPYNMQTVIKGYLAAVDQDILAFVEEVRDGTAWKGKKIQVGTVSERMANDIRRLSGVAMPEGCDILLNTSALEHIERRHGKYGKRDTTMANDADIARINFVIQNYDSIKLGAKPNREYKNADGSHAKTVVLSKKINGTYFVVEAVPDTGKIGIVSAYMNKNGAAQVPNGNPLGQNVQDELASAHEKSVADDGEYVKSPEEQYSVDDQTKAEIAAKEELIAALQELTPEQLQTDRVRQLIEQYTTRPQQKVQTPALKIDRANLRRALNSTLGLTKEQSGQLTQVLDKFTQDVKPKRTAKPKAELDVQSKPTEAKKILQKKLLDLFSVPAGQRGAMGNFINNFADRIVKNGKLTEADRKAFFTAMYEAGAMTVPADEYYANARSYIKGGHIFVPDSVVADLGDDWTDLRRRAFATGIYLTRSQVNENGQAVSGIDVWNNDLASELPGLFDSEETDRRTMLEQIVRVAEMGREEQMSLGEYVARIAGEEYTSENDVLDSMERQMTWALKSFAETARVEIELKDNNLRRVLKERQENREVAQRAKDRKELQDLQKKTMKQLQWLSRNRYKAPEDLQAVWDEVLSDIDLYAIGAANEMNWSEKYGATWKDLAAMYKAAEASDDNFMPSEDLKKIVRRLDAEKIGDMDLGALQDLYKAAVGLRTEFYNRNNVINDEMHRLFAEVYTDAKNEIQNAPGGFTGKWADKVMNMEQLTPMNVLQRMGGWDPDGVFYSMAKQLERGERDMRAYQVKAQRMLQEFLTENADWVKKADGQGKNAIWYEIEVPELLELHMGDKPIFGDTVKVYMTPSQKVHLYLESKNLDNLRHMIGGRTFVNKELYSKGKRQEALAQGRTIRLAPETVKQIVSDLTAEELELAQLLEQYYNVFAKNEINRVSNALYGYDKAMGKNYAPIYTNRNYTKAEFGVFDVTAEGVGNLKGRQHASNPSYNLSAFDAFERHIAHTARFVGMAIPARNWTALMNWKENGNSTADVISHKWGDEGEKYIERLITTLQAGDDLKTDTVSKAVNTLQSNYISAVFGANPGIVLKQLGSIPLAGAYLGASNVPSPAQIAKIDADLISRYTQDLAWRTMGYTTPETKQLKENPNWTQTNKVMKFTFGGGAITAMDGWAASTLWPWAENKVRKDYPDLEIGTAEQIAAGESPFYKKVAELFEEAVARSQSVSDEIHQSSLRKSKNPITRAFTLFRSDSAQTYNTLRQKIGEARFYARTGADSKVKKAAASAVGTAFVALAMNAIWAEGVSLLMALWKNKGKNYRDEEDELTAESVMGEMITNVLGSFAGVITGGEEGFELIGNVLTGEKIYDIETPGMEQLGDVIDAISESAGIVREIIAGAAEVADNGGDVGEYLCKNSGKILGGIKDLASNAAMYIAGFPAGNLEAYLIGALKWISPELGTAYDDLFSDTGKSDLNGMEGDALTTRIQGILKDRHASESEDTAQILAGLYAEGYTSAMPSDTPFSVTVNEEKHELNEYQKQIYDEIWGDVVADGLDDLVSSEAFIDADQETQAKMLARLYSYAADRAKAELFDQYSSSSAKTVDQMRAEGLGLADCISWGVESSGLKQEEKFALLRERDLTDGQKKAVMGTILGTDLKTATGKPTQYAEMLEALEKGLTVDQYIDLRTGGGVGDYSDLVEGGLDPDEAYELVEDWNNLQPADGKDSVSDLQKWRVCVDFSDDVDDQLTALFAVMTEKQFQKVEIANDFGVTPNAYVTLLELRPQYDANGNGSYTQAEIKKAIDNLPGRYTTAQKAVLWQLVTGASSAKNNPYDQKTGQMVLAAKSGSAGSSSGSSSDFSAEIMKQLIGE